MMHNFTQHVFRKRRGILYSFCFLLAFANITPLQAQDIFRNADTIYAPGEDAPPIPGKPYPSEIMVSKLKGVVSSLTVTLHNYSHTNPDALDVLLVAPDGTNAVILSDVGGAADIEDITITLDDAALQNLPDSKTFGSGTYKPTNMGFGPDSWPSPAPAPSGEAALASFSGVDPNGNWSLYLVSDADGASGMVAGGWTIAISTVKAAKATKISSFTGSYSVMKNEVLLNWWMEKENKTNKFIIERALPGLGWRSIGEMSADGIDQSGGAYHFIDKDIEEENQLYRLKIVTEDGSFIYSNTILIKTTENKKTYSVYPNPATTYTMVKANNVAFEKVLVSIMDINRNLIKQQQGEVSSSSPMRFDLSGVKAGTYILTITTKHRQYSEMLSINQ